MKKILRLTVEDERRDVDDVASEVDEPDLNRQIHEVLNRYLGVGPAKSDELLVEINLVSMEAQLLDHVSDELYHSAQFGKLYIEDGEEDE